MKERKKDVSVGSLVENSATCRLQYSLGQKTSAGCVGFPELLEEQHCVLVGSRYRPPCASVLLIAVEGRKQLRFAIVCILENSI